MEHTFKDFGNDILLVEGLLEPSLCQHIIEIAECCQFSKSGILINVVDTDVRNGGILALNDEEGSLQGSTNQLLLNKIKVIQQLLFKHYGIKFPHAEVCSILRYLPGQNYKRHVDNLLLTSRFVELANGIPTRDISIVGYLNDDFEGGETFFDRQNTKVKPQTGSVLVFPAYYTHPHQALPVIRGKKYAFTSWLFH
ncbi:MAG TPA: 2OG-Fe(II) oxygenase [Leptolyngbyaceae cyanobacterium M33_DOE_097]|uniref:2OG-Fe(II) oxygenase n=1 Tax=Oscillatoriales cyanobacterium SpSt-418 TaxID=2282169 RepID=A0A7C3KEL8_9CYAN|nr:2OG-Fe(II) oxygenase [Leptolyngbyaceae cyanobacterium M33_DOE_097]